MPEGTATGGLSGLEVSPDGHRFVALSDSAALVTGGVIRDGDGIITAIQPDGPPQPLTDMQGVALSDPYDDAEGLALAADGSLYVSFELDHRVAHFGSDGRALAAVPVPRDFSAFGENSGLEGLAIADDGALYTLPEGPASGAASIPVFRLQAGQWGRPFTLSGDGTWRPVGADFGPDGQLYLLERDFWPLVGFMSRLRRIKVGPGGLVESRVLLTTAAGQFGNLEGLSIWQDGAGALRATMVSDNNFLPFVPTEFVEALIDDGLDPGPNAD